MLHGYPYLVLQESNAAAGLPLIRVKVADIIAHLTQQEQHLRHAKDRPVLCHFDEPVQQHPGLHMDDTKCGKVWVMPKQGKDDRLPTRQRCYSKMCCNPMCLLYSTQSYNATTGSSRVQRQTRKARKVWPVEEQSVGSSEEGSDSSDSSEQESD